MVLPLRSHCSACLVGHHDAASARVLDARSSDRDHLPLGEVTFSTPLWTSYATSETEYRIRTSLGDSESPTPFRANVAKDRRCDVSTTDRDQTSGSTYQTVIEGGLARSLELNRRVVDSIIQAR